MQIMSKRFYEPIGPKKFNQTPGLCMGTGPYMMKDPQSWTPGQKVELIRNERYWGERGPFDRLVFNEVEGESAEVVMLRNVVKDLTEVACGVLGQRYFKALQATRFFLARKRRITSAAATTLPSWICRLPRARILSSAIVSCVAS